MLRVLVILVVLGTVAMAAPNPPPERVLIAKQAPTTNPNTAAQKNDQNSQKTPPSVVVQVESPVATGKNADDHDNTDKEIARYTGMLAIFTLALVVVGIFQFRMMGEHKKGLDGLSGEVQKQAGHMSRQADLMSRNNVITLATARAAQENAEAAKHTADFALLNAQAVINAERAWVIVGPTSNKRDFYTFNAVNVGQTPAKLVRSFADVIVLGHTTHLPPSPDYQTQRLEGMTPSLCLPKDRRVVFEISAEAISRVKYPQGNAPPNHLEFMEIYFFGKVIYEDTLNTGKTPESSPVHETKWCFKLTPVDGGVPIADPRLIPPDYMGYS